MDRTAGWWAPAAAAPPIGTGLSRTSLVLGVMSAGRGSRPSRPGDSAARPGYHSTDGPAPRPVRQEVRRAVRPAGAAGWMGRTPPRVAGLVFHPAQFAIMPAK